MIRPTVAASLLSLVSACSFDAASETPPDGPLPAPDAEAGFQINAHAVAPPGTEIWRCVVYDLPNEDWTMVNKVESIQNAGMHHMDLLAPAFANVNLEPGDYDCNELYAEHPELMDALIIYASQADEQKIDLPAGIGVNLPPRLRVMHEMHFVNTTDEEADVYSYINAYSTDPADITGTIWGGAVRDLQLNIPAGIEHSEWTRCVMNEDIDLMFLTSHTHKLGIEVSIRSFDGTAVGDELYVNRDWHSPALQSYTDSPLHIPAGTGFEFTCKYNNNTDRTVSFGFAADDEMCSMALVFTPGEARRKCEPVASSDGLH